MHAGLADHPEHLVEILEQLGVFLHVGADHLLVVFDDLGPSADILLGRLLLLDLGGGDPLDKLADVFQLLVVDTQHPANVFDGAPSLVAAHRADGAHVVMPPTVLDVLLHARPLGAREVDVDVGKAGALRDQETLEQQPVFDRVNTGDAQQPGHQGTAHRTPAGPDHHRLGRRAQHVLRPAAVAGGAHVVGDDQEVPGESLVADDLQLGLHPAPVQVTVQAAALHPVAKAFLHQV